MAPHSCKGCLKEIIQKMAKNKETPMEVTTNGTGENGWNITPCKLQLKSVSYKYIS